MSPIVKRKRDKFSIPSKYLLLLLTVVCMILMAVTFLTDFSTLPLNKVAGYVVVPEGCQSRGTVDFYQSG